MNSGTPRTAEAGGKLANNIMYFGRVLRDAGLPVGPATVLDALDAALSGPMRDREDFYWTLHAIFVKRREHREIFDQAFHLFWRKPKLLEQLLQLMYVQVARSPQDARKKQAGFRRLAEAMFDQNLTIDRPPRESEILEIDAVYTPSADEILRKKDFEQMTAIEQSQAKDAIARMKLIQMPVRTRRFQPSGTSSRIDMKQTIRQSSRTGGEMVKLNYRKPRLQLPPLVVLCDISGSCSQYSRMFLHFLHRLANDRSRVRIFLFGTRLSNVTKELKSRDVDEALARVSSTVQDWSGGTRIGSALAEFNRKWARRVLGQGAELLLMTDGLERDDVDKLSAEMQRLRRSCRRIVWLNPLLRYDKFEASAAGIKAIMPYVDQFRPVHNLESLGDLAASLSQTNLRQYRPERWVT